MKLQRIIEAVYHRPWLITESGHASIRALLDSKLAESFPREGEDWWSGKKEDLPGMQIDGGVAVVPVYGVLGQKLSGIEKSCGAVDVRDLSRELSIADGRQDVKGILMDFDSPGGMVGGIPELAEQIDAIDKPVFAFTDSLMASAAYWLGSSADLVLATKTADVGSIGVYMPWVDSSERYKQAGLKVDVVRAGRYKGMGLPGTSLSQEQRQLLQDQVDDIYGMFTGHVRQMRGAVDSETMQGQTFMAKDAAERNLIDALVKDRSEAIRTLY